LPALGTQFLQLALAAALAASPAPEKVRYLGNGLPLPGRDHHVVNAVPDRQLRQPKVAPDRPQRHLRFEIRAVAPPHRLRSRSDP